jgi:hypothetical protein
VHQDTRRKWTFALRDIRIERQDVGTDPGEFDVLPQARKRWLFLQGIALLRPERAGRRGRTSGEKEDPRKNTLVLHRALLSTSHPEILSLQ